MTTHGGTTDASDKQPGVVTIGSKDLLGSAPRFPSTKNPTNIAEVDENLAYWSKLSEIFGVPVVGEDGSDWIGSLLDLRTKLQEPNDPKLSHADGRVAPQTR